MKLIFKFNLIFVSVFVFVLVIVGLIARHFLEKAAREDVIAHARLMTDTAMAVRTYTQEQIRPLLQVRHRNENVFFPQAVPEYSAIENFNYLHEKYPDYMYREATLNPTNLRDRAVDWEADVVNTFRKDPKRTEFVGERDTPDGRSLFLAQPIIAGAACLECHSTPGRAPVALIKKYGSNNGFGWREGEIVGAQIVSVPMALAEDMTRRELSGFFLSLGLVGLVVLVVLNIVLVLAIVRPISRISDSALEISTGNVNVPELPVRGKDEIASLANSFNRMQRSLVKALNMLKG